MITPIKTMTINQIMERKDDVLISDEDIKEMARNVRAKAIDKFAEMLKEKYEENNFDLCLRQNDYYSYSNSCMLFESYIDGIAEQLKAGGIIG